MKRTGLRPPLIARYVSQACVTPAFKSHLKTKLAPLLRDHGFRGSGLTFRRLSDVVLQVVHLQGSRAGDSCCVEIGTHLTFLPTVLEEIADPKNITVHACEFRRRLAPDDAADHWWSYGKTDPDAALSVDQLVTTYATVGTKRLEQYRVFPGPFASMTPELLKQGDLSLLPGPTTVARAALTMARISLHRSMPEQARDFVNVGLEDLSRRPGGGIGIQMRLLDLQRSLGGAG